jgi:hypothetical protein
VAGASSRSAFRWSSSRTESAGVEPNRSCATWRRAPLAHPRLQAHWARFAHRLAEAHCLSQRWIAAEMRGLGRDNSIAQGVILAVPSATRQSNCVLLPPLPLASRAVARANGLWPVWGPSPASIEPSKRVVDPVAWSPYSFVFACSLSTMITILDRADVSDSNRSPLRDGGRRECRRERRGALLDAAEPQDEGYWTLGCHELSWLRRLAH